MTNDYQKVKSTLAYVLALNLLVAALKFIFGVLANSLAMIADAVHSSFDSISNIIGLVGVKAAQKPPDKDHPYGHQKYETFAAAGIAALLFITSVGIISSAAQRFMQDITPQITTWSFAVMAFTMAVNLLVSRHEAKKGRELESEILSADSEHTASDVYASASVIAGFIAVNAGYSVADPLIALLISGFIARSAYRIVKGSANVLVDTQAVNVKEVEKIVSSVEGAHDCHRVRARGGKGNVYVDLHLRVAPDMDVRTAHEVATRVEKKLKDKIDGVKDITVHIEPGS